MLAADPERLLGGGDQANFGAQTQDHLDKITYRAEHMLTVVQDQQRRLATEVVDDTGIVYLALLCARRQSRHNGNRNAVVIGRGS